MLEHRVLAADVVDGKRKLRCFTDIPNNVQIGQCRFDHQDISALCLIGKALTDRFTAVGGVHLIRRAVSEAGSRFGDVAERPVIAAGEFGRIAHDRQIGIPTDIQGIAQCRDNPVHHPRRCDHIGTRPSVNKSLLPRYLQRTVVIHRFVDMIENTAVTVVGVFAKTQVGNNKHFRVRFFDRTDSRRNDPVIAQRIAADRIFHFGDAEQNNRIDPQRL